MPGARRAVVIADVTSDDAVLIVSDNPRIASALVAALKEREESAEIPIELFYLARPLRPIPHMGRTLSSAFEQASVVFNVLEAYHEEPNLRHDEPEFRREVITPRSKTQRIFHMPAITEEAFNGEGALGLSDEEFDEMEQLTREIAVALTIARRARVTSARQPDTDFTLDLGDPSNVAQLSTGRLQPGSWGNLPSGEAFILPRSASGTVVIDTAVSGLTEMSSFKASMLGGQFSIEAGSDTPLRSMIEADEEKARATRGMDEHNVRRVCEFGVGTNPRARAPSFLEIEKIRGTIHIAIGADDAFGGRVSAPSHTDMVIAEPTVELDEVAKVIEGGKVNRDLLRLFATSDHDPPASIEMSEDAVVRRNTGDIARDEGSYLYRRWTDARHNELEALVGSHDTARIARGVWRSFPKPRGGLLRHVMPKHGSRRVSQVLQDADAGRLEGVRSREEATRALRIMRVYGLVSIERSKSTSVEV